MKRRDFLHTSAAGACFCGASLMTSQAAPSDDSEVNELRRKVDFMQKRVARLIAALDEPTRKKVLETMGRECAKEFRYLTDKFKGKPEEFLGEARKQWMDSAEYDEKAGSIRVVDRASHCTCAFVRVGLTPPDFCHCTIGWQKEAYAAILGRPVDAEVESSILRGGNRCAFHIRATRNA